MHIIQCFLGGFLAFSGYAENRQHRKMCVFWGKITPQDFGGGVTITDEWFFKSLFFSFFCVSIYFFFFYI